MTPIRPKSFQYAAQGIIHTLKHHPNFLIHLLMSTVALIAGFVLQISPIEFVLLIITITVGLALELINTSIESVVDLISKEWRLEAKIAKDTSAAAMLVYSIGSVVIALIIFLP